MKHILILFTCLLFASLLQSQEIKLSKTTEDYHGVYYSGKGDVEYLRLIDESFAFFHPNPVVPNLTMVYNPEWNTFVEGAGWGAWWIQNSYGFSYSATPFLVKPWFSMLQRSWDLFWDNQGDGERRGMWGNDKESPLSQLVGPDGCLGDAATPGQIVYKQGDGNVEMHDWFYEATAAGVVMQAEILLASRDEEAIKYYLPKMERACDFIEKTRDSINNLFLVGPACNLLAPSYGGVKRNDGTFGKGYLSGLSITYLAALDRMVELYKLIGQNEQRREYIRRQKITRESLTLLLTPTGYFVKSMEPGGVKHGVLGQKQYGYLEGVANADAVALRVVDDKVAHRIYKQIDAFLEIRPFDFLLTNAPGLDDTYKNWGNSSGKGLDGFWTYGQWVNGGAWGTVEGRAILMYYRLGKFEDIRRSASRTMKWAKDFRMDAPWSQRGENTNNPWSDSGKHKIGEVSVMIDNFAIPAATIRGLFDYDYKYDRLILRPRIPGSITQLTQKKPIRFGEKKLYLSCQNGGPKIKSVKIDGKDMKIGLSDELVLLFSELPMEARIEIVTTGGWPKELSKIVYPDTPSLVLNISKKVYTTDDFQEPLKTPFTVLSAMKQLLEKEPNADFERAYIDVAIKSCEDYKIRKEMNTGAGYFRAISTERKEDINNFFKLTALNMYEGFDRLMKNYREHTDIRKREISQLFDKVQE